MATTHFAWADASDWLPALVGRVITAEAKTPTGTSSQCTAVTPSEKNRYVCRVATDTAVYIGFGEDPTVTSANGYMLPAGAVESFVVKPGDKVAVKTI
jgi:hypothetical protein